MTTKDKLKNNYIYWLLNNCTEPYDEIGYLIELLQSSNKAKAINDTLKIFDNEKQTN